MSVVSVLIILSNVIYWDCLFYIYIGEIKLFLFSDNWSETEASPSLIAFVRITISSTFSVAKASHCLISELNFSSLFKVTGLCNKEQDEDISYLDIHSDISAISGISS